jgi:hypothetical protein
LTGFPVGAVGAAVGPAGDGGADVGAAIAFVGSATAAVGTAGAGDGAALPAHALMNNTTIKLNTQYLAIFLFPLFYKQLFSTMHCLLFTVHYLLSTVNCSLFYF